MSVVHALLTLSTQFIRLVIIELWNICQLKFYLIILLNDSIIYTATCTCLVLSWKLKNREKSHGKVMEFVRVATLDRYCDNSYSY